VSFAHYEPWQDAYRRALGGEHVTLESPQEIAGRLRHFLISFGPIIVDGRVSGAAAFAKDITTRKRAEIKLQQRAETLHYLSVIDQLTQLHNRRGFLELGAMLLRDARAAGQPVQLLFADLDGLKQINDVAGHAAGDAAIRRAGEVLAESVRRCDVVARLGGDEFVILAAGSDHDDSLIERIRRRAAEASVQLSIGGVKSEPGDEPCALEQLIERADALMYEQKLERKRGYVLAAASASS
jgi:diguanylate cyclase (GGDEF)-like protein